MALGDLPDYPWDQMAPYAERARRHPDGIVDLSIGSPVDPTPTLIRDALAWATDAHAYPTTVGTPELRQAMVDWHARRRNATLGTDQVLPTIGSKEMVAWLPFMLGLGEGDAVVHPRVAYPTYEIGAALAGAESVPADDPADWPAHTRLVWLNSPGNPDGRVLGVDELRAAVARARELGAVIASDECYAELGWEGEWASGPTPSILDARVVGDDHVGVLALYSLSKQSNLAGYRAALVAGDRELIARLIRVRKHAGLLPPAPLQHAMTVALGDDAHVRAQRELYRARRDVLRPALEDAGWRIDRSEAGLYLWATRGRDAWEGIAELADLGILAGPGPFYGDASPEHVRLSLTATDERIAQAAARLRAGATASPSA
ncbi:succinyldiaminopimelate transaminase [Clavibacter michiganensis]|uniref:succinyldiaminopimelate transaminase n=1 Tax=Clavibacter michiganensis TaxID=28447 RepID=UPI000A3C45C9|nr:succinyldiaminopimelate transaminase [Clavibacter michiganensis]MBE3079704.1 succinyldiaminopimelate transaminase [Clavibacter michiganensis subsp. michiganensis]MDO4066224.1 succinyldiaminopimelate transaminase [Clavibacter michiganensis]MDO4072820.1 succinyldiaminopimelate transaminase [Clavibacter michiganensis]MDO4090950.1 succinyldiaminopimelate transaminase [Clavibacter michiganensis]OUD92844.1 Glutamate-pyruvate aminotransferase AlaC [Clavibacter michiganensis subsp. michiganensis]